jgi:hypothetical protein
MRNGDSNKIMQSIDEEEIEVQEKENICGQCGAEIPLSDWETKPICQCVECGTYKNNHSIIETNPEYAPIPEINLRWLRFSERICFATKAQLFLALGIKGAGKSSLLECFSIRYAKIIDLYGSSDNESLSYLKPEFRRVWRSIHGSDPSILLVTGQNKDVASNISKFETCHVEQLNLKIVEDHDVITTSELFFDDEDEYYTAIGTIVNILWKQRNHWFQPWFVLIREAANMLFSRLKVVKNDGCAKAEVIKSLREARHHGLACGLDTLRFVNLDKEIRDLSDYTWVKKLGAVGLPGDLHWLYGLFQPLPLMRMKPNTFIVSTASGSVGYGVFQMPIWHKHEHEDILRLTGIEIKNCTEEVPKERKHTLGAFDHTQIIKVYFETKSMNETAKKVDRSFKTVYNHIQQHNDDIRNLKECRQCFNANVPFSKISILVPKAGRPKKEKAYQELNNQ